MTKSMSYASVTVLIAFFLVTSTAAQQLDPRNSEPQGPVPAAPLPPPPPGFLIKSYQGSSWCLDYSPEKAGSPVFLNNCAVAHAVRVEDIGDGNHTVVLHAGTKVIGIPYTEVADVATGAAASPEFPLELLTPSNTPYGNPFFSLDGDSIILVSNRELVAKVENARGTAGTPIVMGTRNLADNEFWDFVATDGSDVDPTSGFVRVSTRDDLLIAMYNINRNAQLNPSDFRCYGNITQQQPLPCRVAWGNVIKIMNDIDLTANPAYIDLTTDGTSGAYFNLVLPTGVTIRGDRRGTNFGPKLTGNYTNDSPTEFDQDAHMFEIEGDYVRITGLRIEGPSDATEPPGSSSSHPLTVNGIHIGNTNPFGTPGFSEFAGVMIDHNEMTKWPNAAIGAFGGVDQISGPLSNPPGVCPATNLTLENQLHITRNFIHHNEQQGLGYGVVVMDGASATILGNTFLMNRHAIAADGRVNDQYSAVANLVLTDVPRDSGISHHKQQDFDMHGTLNTRGRIGGYLERCLEGGCGDQQHDGGYAGNEVDISWNTFLGGNRDNFDLRGEPCGTTDSFSYNVSMQSDDSAIQVWDYNGIAGYDTSSNTEISIPTGNQFGVTNPAAGQLAVGDFDGDGIQDVFLATGSAWYFSPAGNAGWKYLNGGKTDKMKNLLFGDFDGDGRTDVAGIDGSNLMVSWGGISDWEVLNTLPEGATVVDLAVGDFDGDGRADILYADGAHWYLSSGGSGPFNYANESGYRVANLRFGHFSACGGGKETDVFGIVGGKWQVTCGALGDWTPLPVTLTNSLTGLVVADFDGDGNADIATSTPVIGFGTFVAWNWLFSRDGSSGWTTRSFAPTPITAAAAIGFFDSNPGADVLLWGDRSSPDTLSIASGGDPSTLQRQSNEEMR